MSAKKATGASDAKASTRPSTLTIPRPEAESKLINQISIGQALVGREINTKEQMDALERDAATWSEYNGELLRKIFTGSEYFDDYNKYINVIPEVSRKPLDAVEFCRDRVRENVRRLESIHQRLGLMDEFASQPTDDSGPQSDSARSNAVFIVHGANELHKTEVARFLERLGLRPVILHEQQNQGRTLIEKFEQEAAVGYAIVILSADDVGGRKGTEHSKLESRARQNVIFELGFFYGRIGRNKTCVLREPDVELPSDLQGQVWVTIMDGNRSWERKVALRAVSTNSRLPDMT